MVRRPSSTLKSSLSAAALFATAIPGSWAGFARQKWPAYHENELEALWLEGATNTGYNKLQFPWVFPFGDTVLSTCKNEHPSSVAGQWLRLAYHDMSTHNVNGDGLGGLDQSIRFELNRPENVGTSLKQSIFDFHLLRSPYVSFSDAIALAVMQVAFHCGDIVVPFRGGRVDATAAGPAGVPEPQGSLEEHTESFRKQGFNQQEMIELVVCGHSIGSVRNSDFPDVIPRTPQDPPSQNVLAPFDGTGPLDNAIDGNKTMKALTDPAVFATKCRDLFERMINTVPRGVELGPLVEPTEVKVERSFLTFDSTLGLLTKIRFLSHNPLRRVTLKWRSRASQSVHSAKPRTQFHHRSLNKSWALKLNLRQLWLGQKI